MKKGTTMNTIGLDIDGLELLGTDAMEKANGGWTWIGAAEWGLAGAAGIVLAPVEAPALAVAGFIAICAIAGGSQPRY